ncbi:MAG TPA: hypothetical protein VFE45_19305, partial [Coriobacteriia bacterium]|nr:hypothetical protein [Coriobacteriia bacterium]
MRTRTTALSATVALAALALAGCSSGESDPATSAPGDAGTTALSGSLEFMTGTSVDSELYVAYEDITKAFESAN